MTYKANRGGHAPGHLRTLFQVMVEFSMSLVDLENNLSETVPPSEVWWSDAEDERFTVRWLIGQLWNCTDIFPGSGYLDIPDGSTYAQAVRHLKRVIEWEVEESRKEQAIL